MGREWRRVSSPRITVGKPERREVDDLRVGDAVLARRCCLQLGCHFSKSAEVVRRIACQGKGDDVEERAPVC